MTEFSATGGTKTTDGTYTVHVFTSDDSLVCSGTRYPAEVLVIGGGGGGGAGGGGAGGLIHLTDVELTGTMAVVVGGGGTGSSDPNAGGSDGGDGANSTFAGHTAYGGGGGGRVNQDGHAGGSGGGASASDGPNTVGGVASAGQGYDGGPNSSAHAAPYPAAGGGGASAVGQMPGGTIAGYGGAGITSDIVLHGTDVGYAGGGGGGVMAIGTPGTASHGGGAGTNSSGGPAGVGAANTGGGGGGGSNGIAGGNGGSGIVVVRYQTVQTLQAHGGIHIAGNACLEPWMHAHDDLTLDGRGSLENATNLTARRGFLLLGTLRPHLGNAHTGTMSAFAGLFIRGHARLSEAGAAPLDPRDDDGWIEPTILYREGFAMGGAGITHSSALLDLTLELSDHGGLISATVTTAVLGGGSPGAPYGRWSMSCGGQMFSGRLEQWTRNVGDTAGWTLVYAGPMTILRDHKGFRTVYVDSDLQNWQTDQGPRSSPDTFEVVSRSSGSV